MKLFAYIALLGICLTGCSGSTEQATVSPTEVQTSTDEGLTVNTETLEIQEIVDRYTDACKSFDTAIKEIEKRSPDLKVKEKASEATIAIQNYALDCIAALDTIVTSIESALNSTTEDAWVDLGFAKRVDIVKFARELNRKIETIPKKSLHDEDQGRLNERSSDLHNIALRALN